ncbi:MAG: type II secretory pathway pseudopilin PulG, partial [Oleispira sp.]
MLEANLVFVLLIMALVLLLVIISFSMTKKRKRKDRQDIGFQWLATLRLLLAYIQKHRGMSIG